MTRVKVLISFIILSLFSFHVLCYFDVASMIKKLAHAFYFEVPIDLPRNRTPWKWTAVTMATVKAERCLDSQEQLTVTVKLRDRRNFINYSFVGILWSLLIRLEPHKATHSKLFYFRLKGLILFLFGFNQRCKDGRDVCLWLPRRSDVWYNSGFQHPTRCNSIVSSNGTPSPACRITAVYFWNATRDCDQPASVCGFALLIGARCDAQTPGLCGAVQEGPGQVGSAAQHHHRHDSQHTLTGTHNS